MNSRMRSNTLELLAACCIGVALGLLVVVTADFDETKHRVATVFGAIGVVALWLIPDRRALAAAAWIPLHTLGIESIFQVGEPLHPEFEAQFAIVTASDCVLILLFVFEVVDALFGRRGSLRIPPSARIFTLFILWSGFSYLMHRIYLDDGLVHSTPLNMLHLLRTFGFIVILNSAIRSRADLILVSLALLLAVMFQSFLVLVSYATGEVMNFTTMLGETPRVSLMTFSDDSGGDGSNIRATGSIGHTNEQAAFHALTTLPLLALLALRALSIRFIAACTVGASTIALILTFSRGGWLAYFLSFCIFFGICLWYRQIKPSGWYLVALSAVFSTLVLGALADPIYERITNGDEGATESRVRMIMLAVDLATEQPVIGVGPGEFAEAALKYYPPENTAPKQVLAGEGPEAPTVGRLEITRFVPKSGEPQTLPLPVHNKYLLVLSEVGVIGLMLFLIFCWQFLRGAWRCVQKNDTFLRLFGIAGFASVIGSIVYMMLDLFADDKSITTLLLVPVLTEAAGLIQPITGKRPVRLIHTHL